LVDFENSRYKPSEKLLRARLSEFTTIIQTAKAYHEVKNVEDKLSKIAFQYNICLVRYFTSLN